MLGGEDNWEEVSDYEDEESRKEEERDVEESWRGQRRKKTRPG